MDENTKQSKSMQWLVVHNKHNFSYFYYYHHILFHEVYRRLVTTPDGFEISLSARQRRFLRINSL